MSLEPLPVQLGKGRSTVELGRVRSPGKDGSTELLASCAGEHGERRGQEADETRRAGTRRGGRMWGGNGGVPPSLVRVWEPGVVPVTTALCCRAVPEAAAAGLWQRGHLCLPKIPREAPGRCGRCRSARSCSASGSALRGPGMDGGTPPAPPAAVPRALLPPVGAAAPQDASIAPYITPGPNLGVLEQVHQIVN